MSPRLPRIFLALLIPVYAVYLLAPAIGYMHDDGIYLVCARALAAGHGYVIESLPREIAQTKYPILYPALLAPLCVLIPSVPQLVLAVKCLSLVFSGAWLLICHRWLRRSLSDSAAADWIVFFTAASPWAVYLSVSVLPDTFFALVSSGAALLLMRVTATGTLRSLALSGAAGGLAAAALLTRSTGMALIAAAVVFLLWRQLIRQAIVFSAVCLLICAPWLVWQASQTAPIDPLEVYYSKANYLGGHIFKGYGAAQVISILAFNAAYSATIFWLSLGTWTSVAGMAVSGVAAAFIVRALFQAFRRNPDVPCLWGIAYGAMMLCWLWPTYRYLTPLLPFYLFFLARAIPSAFTTPRSRKACSIALVVCAVLSLVTVGRGAYFTVRTGTPSLGSVAPDGWRETLALADWVRENTPADAIIAGGLDPTIYLYTGRKAIRPFEYKPYALLYNFDRNSNPFGGPEDLRRHLLSHGITHVVLTPMSGFSEGPYFRGVFDALRHERSGAFRLVNQLPDARYSVYSVDLARLGATSASTRNRDR